MSMYDHGDFESKSLHFLQNPVRTPTRINNDSLFTLRITQDRTIARQRRNGKCFSNQGTHITLSISRLNKIYTADILRDLLGFRDSQLASAFIIPT